MAKRHDVEVNDAQWEKIKPHLPRRKPSRKGGRPPADGRAYSSDKLRSNLLAKGWDLVCPHRRGRTKQNTQDGRKLRRYRRRWKIERTIAWLHNFRRLIVRYEYYSNVYQAFILLACITICLRRF